MTHIAPPNVPLTMQHTAGASAEPHASKLPMNGPHMRNGPQTNSKSTGKASLSQLKCKQPETNRRAMHEASDKTHWGGANALRRLLRLEELHAQIG